MPKALTDKDYKRFLKRNYPGLKAVDKYVSAQSRLRVICTLHDEEYETSYFNLSLQKQKHPEVTSICSQCTKERKPTPQATFTTLLSQEQFEKKLQEKFGRRAPELLSPLRGLTKDIKFRCQACSTVQTNKARALMNKSAGCQTCAKRTWLVNKVDELERATVTFLYKELHYSTAQIAEVTGLTFGTVERLLTEMGRPKNVQNSVRRRLEQAFIAKAGFQAYKYQADRVTWHVYNQCRDNISTRIRSLDWHLDHQVSVYDGYHKWGRPLSLKEICHPANFRIVSKTENLTKNRKSSLSLIKLRRKIKAYDKKFGPVLFPDKYVYYDSNTSAPVSKGLTVVGLDPGKSNFGVYAGKLGGIKTLRKVKTLESFMLKNPITKIDKDLADQMQRYSDEIRALLLRVKPDVVVAERFQSRGLMGPTVELVGLMLGALGMIVSQVSEELGKSIALKLPLAASWKNQVNRVYDLDTIYEPLKKSELHRVDAALLAFYAFPTKNPYLCLNKNTAAALVSSLFIER